MHDTCQLSYDKHLSNVEVRAISGNTSVNKKWSFNKDVCLSEPPTITARTQCV